MKQTRIRPISKKRARQYRQELKILPLLCERAGGTWNGYFCVGGNCEECKQPADWRGLSKHEIKSRAQGGDPTDMDNCKMLCGKCHSLAHGIKEV